LEGQGQKTEAGWKRKSVGLRSKEAGPQTSERVQKAKGGKKKSRGRVRSGVFEGHSSRGTTEFRAKAWRGEKGREGVKGGEKTH